MVYKVPADQRIAASVDPREVGFYSGLAETWWDRRGTFWPLHRLNELRVNILLIRYAITILLTAIILPLYPG